MTQMMTVMTIYQRKKNCKKKHSEDKKKETGNHTYEDNMDDVQPVNSEMDVIGPTSENSPVTPTPRHNRRRTHSARSNDGDASRKNLHKGSKEQKKFLKAKKMIMQKV